MKLTIISHTEHYRLADGTIVGLSSTVTEINHLLEIFDSITHIAMLHDVKAPPNVSPYKSKKISFIAISPVGGTSIHSKLGVLLSAPQIIKTVGIILKDSDYFQFRAPTGIGVYLIPFLLTLKSKKGWFKYAGNWKQQNAPWSYRLQKWLLMQQSRPVTINGYWQDQPSHCISFENPCLTLEEYKNGQHVIRNKGFNNKQAILCFVGRLEVEKGIGIFIESIYSLSEELQNQIKCIHIVGDGNEREIYEEKASLFKIPFHFHGTLSRDDVHDIYRLSHAIVLPSLSEGFPKVISEAMNYGCLPIVSNISSISHYITHLQNGFLMEDIDVAATTKNIKQFLNLDIHDFKQMIESQKSLLKKFTYDYYNTRLLNEVL